MGLFFCTVLPVPDAKVVVYVYKKSYNKFTKAGRQHEDSTL